MKKFIIILLILFSLLLFLTTCYLSILQKETQNIDKAEIIVESKTIQDVIKKHKSEFLRTDNNKIYVIFGKDLFDEDGESNEKYFNDLIDELKQFFEKTSFYIIDEEKSIHIYVEYTIEDNYVIKINNKENFFEIIDGKSYSKVDTSRITSNSKITIANEYLKTLSINSMYFSSIEDDLGEGKELENGYTSYKDGTIKIRLAPTKAVRNIIFSEDYEGRITTEFNSGMSLREIYDINPEIAFGGLSEKYLGYKDGNYYLFFYDDEVSIYTYSYNYNEDFEDSLADYLQNKDLDTFVNRLTGKIEAYDAFEYDKENKNVYILYSNRGIEINIKNNDSKGIKLYTNYRFSDETREYVKEGLIEFDSNTDLLEKVEKERRNK